MARRRSAAWHFGALWAVLLGVLPLAGCQTAYYGTMERLGVHKRDILVDRVEEAQSAQEAARDQFVSALDQFRSLVAVEGGELESTYDTLNGELQRSETRADTVHTRIDAIEDVAQALFDEWNQELSQYHDASLRRASEQRLAETQRQYAQLMAAMRRAEDKIEPVLSPMRDQVLFLKHNLNARAIASLETEVDRLNVQVDSLVQDLEHAIAEADAFVRVL
ncbi:MAG: DUF2959 domain-containing protein, partial [Candidatus Hydrogenedentes bacterium]|nr:DUF2959 domain-containing protein [Candidatus Hydrogenedentota bacterium]